MQDSQPRPFLQIAPVREDLEYLQASILRRGKPLALALARLAPEHPEDPASGGFLLEWLIPDRPAAQRDLRKKVQDSIDLFRQLEPGAGFWPYLIYHTTTASNLYSHLGREVYWELISKAGDVP